MTPPSRNYKSQRVKGYLYKVRNPKRRMQISADLSAGIVEHKGRWIVAFTHGWEREFLTCDTLNRSEALKMISFLCDYINLVKPTEATVLNKSIRARTNGMIRDAEALTALAMEEMK